MSKTSFKHFVLIGSGFATGAGFWLTAGCMSADVIQVCDPDINLLFHEAIYMKMHITKTGHILQP